MLRTTLAKAYIKRTCRPLYAFSSATPKSCYLDPTLNPGTNPIYPGMAMSHLSGEVYTVAGSGMKATGLAALYAGGDGINEVAYSGINAFAVWVLGPDAEFEVLAPAFDTTADWTEPTDGTEKLVTFVTTSGANQGKLTTASASASNAVARLIKTNSATKITIGGLSGRAA